MRSPAKQGETTQLQIVIERRMSNVMRAQLRQDTLTGYMLRKRSREKDGFSVNITGRGRVTVMIVISFVRS